MNVVLDGAEGIVDGGHSPPYVTMVADFASLYPPYTWIPASAGMTRQVQQPAAGGLGVSPNSLIPPKSGGSRGLVIPHPHSADTTDRTGVT